MENSGMIKYCLCLLFAIYTGMGIWVGGEGEEGVLQFVKIWS